MRKYRRRGRQVEILARALYNQAMCVPAYRKPSEFRKPAYRLLVKLERAGAAS